MTVSRALRTPDLVSEKLREKIQQVVDELGYIPNKAAGALASAESYSIALILPSLVEKSCAHFLPNFQHTLNKAGYQLLLGYSGYSVEQEEKLLCTFWKIVLPVWFFLVVTIVNARINCSVRPMPMC